MELEAEDESDFHIDTSDSEDDSIRIRRIISDIERKPTRHCFDFSTDYPYDPKAPYLYETTDHYSSDDEDENLLVPIRKVKKYLRKRRSHVRALKMNIGVLPVTGRPHTEHEIQKNQEMLYNISNMNHYFCVKNASNRHVPSLGDQIQKDQGLSWNLSPDSVESFVTRWDALCKATDEREQKWLESTEGAIMQYYRKHSNAFPQQLIPYVWPPPHLGLKKKLYEREKSQMKVYSERSSPSTSSMSSFGSNDSDDDSNMYAFDSDGDVIVDAFGIPSTRKREKDPQKGYHPNLYDYSRPGNIDDWIMADCRRRNFERFPEEMSETDRLYPINLDEINNDSDYIPTSEDDFSREYWSEHEHDVQPQIGSRYTDQEFEESFEFGNDSLNRPLPIGLNHRELMNEDATELRCTMHKTIYCSKCKFIMHQEINYLMEPLIRKDPPKKYWCFKCHKAQFPVRVLTQCERKINNVPCRDCFTLTASAIDGFEFTLYTDTDFWTLKNTILRNQYDDIFHANHQFGHENWHHFQDQMYDFVKHYHYHRNRTVIASRKVYDFMENKVRHSISHRRLDRAKHYLCCLYLARMVIRNASQKKVTFPWWFLRHDRDVHDRVCEICTWARLWDAFGQAHVDHLIRYYTE